MKMFSQHMVRKTFVAYFSQYWLAKKRPNNIILTLFWINTVKTHTHTQAPTWQFDKALGIPLNKHGIYKCWLFVCLPFYQLWYGKTHAFWVRHFQKHATPPAEAVLRFQNYSSLKKMALEQRKNTCKLNLTNGLEINNCHVSRRKLRTSKHCFKISRVLLF